MIDESRGLTCIIGTFFTLFLGPIRFGTANSPTPHSEKNVEINNHHWISTKEKMSDIH